MSGVQTLKYPEFKKVILKWQCGRLVTVMPAGYVTIRRCEFGKQLERQEFGRWRKPLTKKERDERWRTIT